MQLKASSWQPTSACVRRSRVLAVAALIALGLVLVLGSPPAYAAQLTASWSDATPDDHTGFKVERKTGTTGAFMQVASTGPTVMFYLDTTLTAGTTYCYRVRAYNTAGDSPYTPEACAVAPTSVVRTLTVTKSGTGTGTVDTAPAGISCGSTCSATYTGGTTVSLSATPATGATFTGWSGACTGTSGCALVLDADKSATATFALPTYALTVTKAGTGTGTVTSSPTGITCGSTCSASYNSGTSVTLTATPATGSTFTGWSGACTGTGTCSVSMTAVRSVAATFTLPTYALTVSKAGTGSGTVTSSPAGITCGSTCSASYTSGTSVTLTAAAATGSTFSGWSGACTGTGTCVVPMTAAQSVTASFAPTTYALTVSKSGTGTGTVTSSPTGITCGSTCSASYNSGTSVTLTATPATGSTFTGWSGAGCSGTGSCTVTLIAPTTLTASFTPPDTTPPAVSITTPTTTATYSTATSPLTLGGTASDNVGVTQVSWANDRGGSGTASGTTSWSVSGLALQSGANVLSVTARDAAGNTRAATLTVTYTPPITYNALNVSVSGSGNVISTPSGIDCGIACSAAFGANTTVNLTATPATGFTFTGWSGGGCSGAGICTVTMDAAKTVTATFAAAAPTSTYTLTVSKIGNGTGRVISAPAGLDCVTNCNAAFGANTSVMLTANPGTGSTFTGWGGACAGTGPCTLTMTQAKSVTATYRKTSRRR
jgi:hypothetical protein